jgi:hypothetical protein
MQYLNRRPSKSKFEKPTFDSTVLCPAFSIGHSNRQNLLYRITQEITGRPHEHQWSIIPVHDHNYAVFIICAPSLGDSNECKYVCGCPASNKATSPQCTFTRDAKNDPRIGYCRLDIIRTNKTMLPLRELPDNFAAPISSNGVATFNDWMGQKSKVDRSRRINTEELVKASHEAHLDREGKLHERVQQILAGRTATVLAGVAELSGTQFLLLFIDVLMCIMYRTT